MLRRLVAIAATLICGCAHTVRHDAPERVAAATSALADVAGHPVTIAIDEGSDDEALARLAEQFAAAISRHDPKKDGGCLSRGDCSASFFVAIDADTLTLARALQRVEVTHTANAFRSSYRSGVLSMTLPRGVGVARLDPAYGIDVVIGTQLNSLFSGRSPPQVTDDELARYTEFLSFERCPVTQLTAVYARLRGHERNLANDMLVGAPRSQPCAGDSRVRATWTTWFGVHAKDLDDDHLRTASRNVFPAPGQPTSTELPGLTPAKYAIAVMKRSITDPTSSEARVLTCSQTGRCASPVIDYYTMDGAAMRRRDLARALVAERSAELTAVACRMLFAARGASQWRAEFIEALTGNTEVWTTAMTAAFRADAAAMNDQLVDIWQAHVPLRPALLRAANAAADGSSRGDIIRDVVHLSQSVCRSDRNSDFFTVFAVTVPASSALATEVTRNGTSCRAFQ